MSKTTVKANCLAEVISKLIKKEWEAQKNIRQMPRLLVSALTDEIGQQLHRGLLDHGVNSKLVTEDKDKVSDSDQIYSQAAVVTFRNDEFLFIVPPGNIAKVRDSIKGSGGVIREETFPSNWPWDDTGPEYCSFFGEILPGLYAKWRVVQDEVIVAFNLVIKKIMADLELMDSRLEILLDQLLGQFSPSATAKDRAVLDEFFEHCRIPFSKPDEVTKQELDKTSRVCRKIRDKIQGRQRIRDEVIEENLPNVELDIANPEDLIRAFVDGVRAADDDHRGLFAVSQGFCYLDAEQTGDRNPLTLDVLQRLFIPEQVRNNQAELQYCGVDDGSCIESKPPKTVIARHGDELQLKFRYKIGDFYPQPEQSLLLGIKYRTNELARTQLNDDDGRDGEFIDISQALDTSLIAIYKNVSLACSLFDDQTPQELAKCPISLRLLGEQRRYGVFVDGTLAEIKNGDSRSVGGLVHIVVAHEDHALTPTLAVDDKDRDLEPYQGFYRTKKRIDLSVCPEGRVDVVVGFGPDDEKVEFTLESETQSAGRFTIDQEFIEQVTKNNNRKAKTLAKQFAGTKTECYRELGGFTDGLKRLGTLAKYCDDSEAGYLPVLADLFDSRFRFRQEPTVEVDYFRIACNSTLISENNWVFRSPEPAVKDAITDYRIARREATAFLVDRVTDVNVAMQQFPKYAYIPVYNYKEEDHISHLLTKYIQSYRNLLDVNKSSDLWASKFLVFNVDSVVGTGVDDIPSGVRLLGPWHPIVLCRRFFFEMNLYSFFGEHCDNKDKSANLFGGLAALIHECLPAHWLPGIHSEEVEPTLLRHTGDTGWIATCSQSCLDKLSKGPAKHRTSLDNRFKQATGLGLFGNGTQEASFSEDILKDYLRAFPSSRRLHLDLGESYSLQDIARPLKEFLVDEDGKPTKDIKKLPGGVHAFGLKHEASGSDNEIGLNEGQLFVYETNKATEPLAAHIHFLPPENSPRIQVNGNKTLDHAVRGTGAACLISYPGRDIENVNNGWRAISGITEGAANTEKNALVAELNRTVTNLQQSIPGNHWISEPVQIPDDVKAPWVHLPAQSDPALIKRSLEKIEGARSARLLWDFKIGLFSSETKSFYILSEVNREVPRIISKILKTDSGTNEREVATDVIAEMGQLGIALAKETQSTTKKAKGCVGLVAASRMFRAGLCTDHDDGSPGSHCKTIRLLIPVDPFESLLGKEPKDSIQTKLCDLLAIKIWLGDREHDDVVIQALGIEAKYRSKKPGPSKQREFLLQGIDTIRRLQRLIDASREESGLPLRVAILKIIGFGMRLLAVPADPVFQEAQSKLMAAIIDGRLCWWEPRKRAAAIITSPDYNETSHKPNAAEDGLFIQLKPSDWPSKEGETESDKITKAREELYALFDEPYTKSEIPERPKDTSAGPQPEISDGADKSGALSSSHDRSVSGNTSSAAGAPSSGPAGNDAAGGDLENKGPINSDEQPDSDEQSDSDEQYVTTFGLGASQNGQIIKYDAAATPGLLNFNIMITGSAGTGKTQFLKYLVCKCREQGTNVLLIDLKKDFADDKVFIEQAKLHTHFVNFDGLPYNPLIPSPVIHPGTHEKLIQVGQHISGIANLLRVIFGGGDQQEADLKKAISDVYDRRGVSSTGTEKYREDRTFPDFSAVGQLLRESNEKAWNRLTPLFNLELFRHEYQAHAFDTLLTKSAVIDLSMITSDKVKNAMARLLIISAHSYYNAQKHTGGMRQILAFDEAHRVIESPELEALVRECRAYGVSTVLSSQSPSDFSDIISAQMHTKILHGADRSTQSTKAICKLVGHNVSEEEAAGLNPFEAIVDNIQHAAVIIKTMNYPIYLIVTELKKHGVLRLDKIPEIEGFDAKKGLVEGMVNRLEAMGLVNLEGDCIRATGKCNAF